MRVIPERASGVQLHITSLPDGRLGASARDFVDWLAAAGQSVWQVLPVSVPDEHGSPYKSPSAFAASPALLEHPHAPVSHEELSRFAERESYWVGSWTAFGGRLEDQVRFAREWTELRAYAEKFHRLFLQNIYKWVQAPLSLHVGNLDLDRERALQLPVVTKPDWTQD